MEVYTSNTGNNNAGNVGYPTLTTKPKAKMKTNFAFYIHFLQVGMVLMLFHFSVLLIH